MRQTAVFFIVLGVCGWAASTAPGQQAQNQNVAAPRECVAVMGAVHAPARFELKRRTTLIEVLAFAGGFTKNAGATIQLIHTDSKCPKATGDGSGRPAPNVQTYQTEEIISGKEPANAYLEAGDIVVVSEAESAFILGAVVQPQQIALRHQVTLTQAIAMAGGLRREAKVEKVRIIRRPNVSGPRIELFVNLKAIGKKKAKDVLLQANDIVEVPGLNPSRPMFAPYDAPRPAPPDRVISEL